MKLITKEVENRLPSLYSTEKQTESEKTVAVKFFDCMGQGRWYVLEGNKLPDGDWRFFGYVTGMGHNELGYFHLNEMKSALGWRLERDMHFKNGKILLRDIVSGTEY